MTLDDRSDELFGRYQALRVYATLARLSKSEFTTGEIAKLTGIAAPALSKELRRLTRLDVIRATSRRGDYERLGSPFWDLVESLAREWES